MTTTTRPLEPARVSGRLVTGINAPAPDVLTLAAAAAQQARSALPYDPYLTLYVSWAAGNGLRLTAHWYPQVCGGCGCPALRRGHESGGAAVVGCECSCHDTARRFRFEAPS